MNAATLRNMTLEELTQYVDQCDNVPRDVVLEIILWFESNEEENSWVTQAEESERLAAVDAIRNIIDKPPKTKALIFEALEEWVTEWDGIHE